MSDKLVFLLLYSLVTLVSTSNVLDKYKKNAGSVVHGRYSRDIHNPHFLVPRHVTEDGKFSSYELPKYYDHREINERDKRSSHLDTKTVHLMLPFNGIDHHVELTPYHEFISPQMVIETRGPGIERSLNEGLRFTRASDDQCHYRGHVRGHLNSRAALSLCDGVAGYVQTNDGRYFIEPVDASKPESDGQHVHIAYSREIPHEIDGSTTVVGPKRFCGTSSNWEAAWAEQLAKKQQFLADNKAEMQPINASTWMGSSQHAVPRQNSGSHSIHRYIEAAVICDRRFLDYHKQTDYEKYVMTIMNMVSDFWHDASCGNQVDVIVVRVIYLEQEKKEIDLNISPKGEQTLDSFAAWAHKLNPKDLRHPNHHDVALLLTRYDICSKDASCELTGLAFVAGACDPPHAAAINEDAGLVLGIVVAHEIGHLMGCAHDSVEETGCPYQNDKDKSYYLMSPVVSLHTIKWSTCSRKLITTFLESGLGECLNNNPRNPSEKYSYANMLPGTMYDRDAQCNLQMPGSKNCDMGQDSACTTLYCEKGTQCFSKGDPPADGTKCGERKWCIHLKCVGMGSRPSAVNGGWGQWGPMSQCSRTCGLGIKISERECNKPIPSNGGKFCIGERKRYEICNPTPCDPSKPPFRAVQCTAFNNKPVGSDQTKHKWIPYFATDLEPCALYCINEKNTYIKLEPVVKDGTPCKGGTNNICISGGCRKVGCDFVVDSSAIEDNCGVCQGDGTTCSPVEGLFTKSGLSNYQAVVTIPKGARSVRVLEKGPSKNTLAVKTKFRNKYCLNGKNKEQRDGDYPCAGSLIVYSHPQKQKEELWIHGPLEEPIVIEYVFYRPRQNPGIVYTYYIKGTVAKSVAAKYSWDFTEWGECSARCGGGTAISEPSCIEETSGMVSPSFCKHIKRPDPKSRICNEQPCPANWRVSQWSKCSACGGKKGVRQRKVQCVKPAPSPGGDDIIAEFDACTGKVPIQEESCVGEKPCKKVCSKKSRECNYGEIEIPDPKERQRVITEQRRAIDNLVDLGLARYLEKTRHETAREISGKPLKRDISVDFKSLLKDWILLGNDKKDKRTCNKNLLQKASCGTHSEHQSSPNKDSGGEGHDSDENANHKMVTLKPGSIVKDVRPPGDTVLYEVPIVDLHIKGNISDTGFQQAGDKIPIGVNNDEAKVYHGLEAVKKLTENSTQTPKKLKTENSENPRKESSESSKISDEPSNSSQAEKNSIKRPTSADLPGNGADRE
ncbi:A disintegrin and metalloproteinase with thrombospondin motifs 7-like [Venturia canescens]|uniref:A disintegrin and metalloproteinase with thrombospondin motifs 7-like n=1 Tax=Venturia canescens TaxID=32260 RepID=UPI001C9BE859|nr:A disintegrin and metalloproteinase with thrombospondin motifs 7-like [Venturia canescens]